jgi:hypothetical protein
VVEHGEVENRHKKSSGKEKKLKVPTEVSLRVKNFFLVRFGLESCLISVETGKIREGNLVLMEGLQRIKRSSFTKVSPRNF